MFGNKIDDVGQDFLDHLRKQPPQPDPNQPNQPLPPTGDKVEIPGGTSEKPVDRGAPSKGIEQPGNPDNPYRGQVPTPVTPPSPEAYGGGPQQSAARPSEPSPVAAGQAQPFTPMPGPSPMDLVQSRQFDQLGKGSLTGSAGGLLGGGLDVAGNDASSSSAGGPSDSLLPLLLKLLAQQGEEMPKLRTPYGTLGPGGSAGRAAASGAADAVQESMQALLRQALQRREAEQQSKLIGERERQTELSARANKAAEDIRSGTRQLSDYSGSDLEPGLTKTLGNFKLPMMEQIAPVIGKVGADTTNSQLQALLDSRSVDTTPQFGMMGRPNAGGVDEDNEQPALPSTQYGPVASKPWQVMTAARNEAGTAESAAAARKATELGAQSGAETTGRLNAEHVNAPTALSDEAERVKTLGPLNATNEGLSAASRFDTLNTPERQKAAATGAGLEAGARAGAEQPFAMARMREQEKIRSAGMKSDELWKLSNIPTSSTKTMMEGAKMIIPRIDDLAKEATALDKAGLFGPVMSRVRHIAAKIGTVDPDELASAISNDPDLQQMDPLVGRFATELGLTASGMGRVHGQARGGGSIQMISYMKGLLNDSSTLDMFLGRLAGGKSYMDDYAAGPQAPPQSHFNPADYAPGKKPGAAAANPADRFLRR